MMSKSLIVYFLFSANGNIKSQWLYIPAINKADEEIKEYLDFIYLDEEIEVKVKVKVIDKTFCIY